MARASRSRIQNSSRVSRAERVQQSRQVSERPRGAGQLLAVLLLKLLLSRSRRSQSAGIAFGGNGS
jgi:hypothetical protein